MNKDIIKRIIISCIFCLILLAVMLYFFIQKEYQSYQSSHQSNVRIRYELDDYITIKNKIPLSDAIAKKYDGSLIEDGTEGYIEFSILNEHDKMAIYEILLKKNKISPKEIPDSCIRLFLTDDRDMPMNGFDGNVLPLYRDLPYLVDQPSSKLLYSGILEGNSTHKFRLRAWYADHCAISGVPETFQFEVSVKNH